MKGGVDDMNSAFGELFPTQHIGAQMGISLAFVSLIAWLSPVVMYS
jgi:hypothetical protein